MDYREYEAEDFLLDPLFREYCLGKNKKAVRFWEEWMAVNPEKLNAVRQARQLYALLNGNHGAQGFLADERAFRSRFAEHTGEDRELPRELVAGAGQKRKRYYGGAVVLSLSASLLIFLLIRRPTAAVRPVIADQPVARAYVQTSKAGERKSFQLPDGTKVMLNAGSTLRIPANFSHASREISLEGEAFFDVARDARKPFVIHTNLMDIKVLGTAFNIKAYPADASTETTLLTGSVEVLVKDGNNKKFILHPSEKIIVPNTLKTGSQSGQVRRKAVAAGESYKIKPLSFNKGDSSLVEISWTESRLAFDGNSFEEIALELERWYNVSIRFEDESIKDFRFTATFDKKTIVQVLNALQLSRPFGYRQEEDGQIVIGGPGKSQ